MNSVKSFRTIWYRRLAIGSSVHGSRSHPTRSGMRARAIARLPILNRWRNSRSRRRCWNGRTTISVCSRWMKWTRTIYHGRKPPSRSNGRRIRALSLPRSSRRPTRSTFTARSIGITLPMMKIWDRWYLASNKRRSMVEINFGSWSGRSVTRSTVLFQLAACLPTG